MGCDIHAYSERFENNLWVAADEWVPHPDYEPNLKDELYNPKIEVDYDSHVYTGRDYCLFGLLAKVRTETSFSFDPKGIPKNASPEVYTQYQIEGDDAHTASYLTLTELLKLQKRTQNVFEHLDSNDDFEIAEYALPSLNKLVANLQTRLTETVTSTDLVRIVFWFDN